MPRLDKWQKAPGNEASRVVFSIESLPRCTLISNIRRGSDARAYFDDRLFFFFHFILKLLPRDYQLNFIRLIRCAACFLRDFFLKDSSANDTSTNPLDGK